MAGNTSWMKARQTKFAAYTAVYVLIVLAVRPSGLFGTRAVREV